jgi:lon-related putative ATP-dependent protease
MSKEERSEILAKQRAFQDLLRATMRQSRELEKEANQQLLKLEQQAALYAIEDLFQELMEFYQNIEEVPEYLEDMKNDILDNLSLFLQKEEETSNVGIRLQRSSLYQRYEVNVLVDNSKLEKAPIIVELNPSFHNLFGKIERESIMGTLVTNFTLIRSGALHEANGGFLILPLTELLREPFSWDSLKRALRNRCIEIEDPTEKLGFISAKSLKPEPIPLDMQVILIGQQHLFYLLHQFDNDFHDLFKVKADFDVVMPATEENITDLCRFVNSLHESEKILPVEKTALTKIIEHGHRLAEHQEKLTTQLDEITDTLREANYYAEMESAENITAGHITKAILEKHYRSDLIYEKVKELIEREIIIIDVEGQKTGQVNGLAVLDLGDTAFGRPNRITASVSVGLQGIIDIEREVELGDPVHSKGVMILSGFLFEKFGKDKPINLSARLVFEQNYSGIAGDSASSAEVYAILSALSGLPLKQGIAVTGSVNQKGQIQAVGGINQKIEGFFEVCRQKGLTGAQGVLLPASNAVHLMLKEEVVEAVAQDKFHLWAVDSVDEGIEILTGVKAGATEWVEKEGKLKFEKESVYDRVNQRLLQLSKAWKAYGRPGAGQEGRPKT